jgi:hypothetical protein
MGGIAERIYCRICAIEIAEKTRYKTLMPPLVECDLQRRQKMIVLERKQATGLELRAFVFRT